jgi:hypothetical protein
VEALSKRARKANEGESPAPQKLQLEIVDGFHGWILFSVAAGTPIPGAPPAAVKKTVSCEIGSIPGIDHQ